MRVNAWFPCLTGLVAVVLSILILLSGLNRHTLTNFFFLKADTTSFNAASQLSNSTFLQDLSKLTHVDFVGQGATAASLGLADTYTISLLTLCGKNKTGTECSSPHFGFNFNPESDLRLSDTTLQNSLPGALPSYGATAKFLSIAYVVSILLTFFAPLVNLFTHSPAPALGSALMSTLSTILLLAASIDSIVTFINFNKAFNSVLSPFGAHSSVGSALFAISWIATAFSLATTILLFRSYQAASKGRGGRMGARDLKVEAEQGPRSHRLLNRIPTWKVHEYRQINRKGVQVQNVGGTRDGGAEEDFDPLVRNIGMEGAEDEHDLGPIDNEAPHRGIAMQVFKNGPQRNADTMYEPFRES